MNVQESTKITAVFVNKNRILGGRLALLLYALHFVVISVNLSDWRSLHALVPEKALQKPFPILNF